MRAASERGDARTARLIRVALYLDPVQALDRLE
jgi:hypothetical protein